MFSRNKNRRGNYRVYQTTAIRARRQHEKDRNQGRDHSFKSVRPRQEEKVNIFRRKQQPELVPLTEQEVITHVSSLHEEAYKKLLKKFTAYRNLEKEIRAIDDDEVDFIDDLELDGEDQDDKASS